MDPIQAATEVIDLRDQENTLRIKNMLTQLNIDRSTLSRRHRGQTGSMSVKKINQ